MQYESIGCTLLEVDVWLKVSYFKFRGKDIYHTLIKVCMLELVS